MKTIARASESRAMVFLFCRNEEIKELIMEIKVKLFLYLIEFVSLNWATTYYFYYWPIKKCILNTIEITTNMQDIIKKFRFKEKAIVINAPTNLEIQFVELGFKTSFEKNMKSKNTVVFINNNNQYLDFLKNKLKNIESDSVLWFAYPKGTSKIKTDINRDTIRVTGEEFNITTVSAISIDNTWSGLRFRPIDRVGK